jgi:cyclopropane-fatty-acyl-phospholipid synthase
MPSSLDSFALPALKARLGFGRVWHHRSRPRHHSFSYRAFFIALPSSELLGPPSGNWWFGINRAALLSVNAQDHGLFGQTDPRHGLTTCFNGEDPMLYCFARVFGYQFKPVSFWLSSTRVLAEVHNTFGESHAYVMDRAEPLKTQKALHVSPFCEVKGHYEFNFRESHRDFFAGIDYFDESAQAALIRTRIGGKLVSISARSLCKALLTYPLFSAAVIARIHWQALRLWRKKIEFFPKPPYPGVSVTQAFSQTTSSPSVQITQPLKKNEWPHRVKLAFKLLKGLSAGHLLIFTPGQSNEDEPLHFGVRDGTSSLSKGSAAKIHLLSWNPIISAMKRGDIGFAQSWIDGEWETPDLAAVLDLAVANRTVIDQAIYGNWLGQWYYRCKHLLRRNSRRGAVKNIHAHYDLGNAFYQLWLDETMTYSSALFDAQASSERALAAGQERKYQRILNELELLPNAEILEIGCGWGGFAERAARQGHRLKALTLSTEQCDFARVRLDRANLSSSVRFALQDYRDEQDQYDGVVSIEMFEAVGEAYWPQYFKTLARCLKPGGKAVVQTITIRDDLFERYRTGTDFIQQYIFPGGMLPSISVFERLAAQHGLHIVRRHQFGQDYASTLRQWRHRFMGRLDEVRALNFDTAFIRTWEFYLAYCEAAFNHGNTDVVQFTLAHRPADDDAQS